MPISVLSSRSGVPETTVKRILKEGPRKATLVNVDAIAEALGMSMKFEPVLDSLAFQQQQAQKKARRIAALVQGSSTLEEQAVGNEDVEIMVQRTVHELMAASKRKLWAD